MVAKEFLDLSNKFKITNYFGLEDVADKLNFLGTVVVFILSGLIVTMKTYILKPIACYTPINPSGSNFASFLTNICWIDGSVPILKNENLPDNKADWEKRYNEQKISYYQWVPIILGIQCLMFYIPRLIWQTMCYNKLGVDLEDVFKVAVEAADGTTKERKSKADDISNILGKAFHFHRDYKNNRWANFRRRIFKITSYFMMSRRMGTWLVSGYIFVKLLYIVNAVGQLVLMYKFLQIEDSNIFAAGFSIINALINGKTWEKTRIFPRQTVCKVSSVVLVGSQNDYLAYCSLPMNMLNEKIYMFIWIWVLIVFAVTVISLIVWLYRMTFRRSRIEFLKSMLKVTKAYSKQDRLKLDEFIDNYLRHDGLFIIKMMSVNCGDLITSDVTEKLWEKFRNDENNSLKDPVLFEIYPNTLI